MLKETVTKQGQVVGERSSGENEIFWAFGKRELFRKGNVGGYGFRKEEPTKAKRLAG